MYKLNIYLWHATNYFIQLFYKTDKKYSCTRPKIAKLLSIVAFKYAKKNVVLFDPMIYKYPNCGTLIKDLTYLIPTTIYPRPLNSVDKNSNICILEIHNDVFIPSQYRNISSLPNYVINELQNVFLRFGAYSTLELGVLLNPIVDLNDVTEKDGNVKLEKIRDLKKQDFEKSNELIEFLFSDITE